MNTAPPEAPKKVELSKIVFYAVVGLMVAVLIFLLVKSLLDQKRDSEQQTNSTSAVILEVKVRGNYLSYYVNYLVKNRKGQLVQLSPYELYR